MNSQHQQPLILVVNESLNILDLFHDILDDNNGYEVELSNYAFEGIESIERLQPDLIIFDFDRAGQKQEWQLLQMLKMNRETASIPIILCALAIREFREQEDHLQKQNIWLLYKPFIAKDLLELVRHILPLPTW
jgi:CheY-like chemotaxis protein